MELMNRAVRLYLSNTRPLTQDKGENYIHKKYKKGVYLMCIPAKKTFSSRSERVRTKILNVA